MNPTNNQPINHTIKRPRTQTNYPLNRANKLSNIHTSNPNSNRATMLSSNEAINQPTNQSNKQSFKQQNKAITQNTINKTTKQEVNTQTDTHSTTNQTTTESNISIEYINTSIKQSKQGNNKLSTRPNNQPNKRAIITTLNQKKINQPTEGSNNQSPTQSINKTNDQAIKHSTKQPIKQPNTQKPNQSINQA